MFLTKVGKKTAASILCSVWYVELEFLPFKPSWFPLFFFWEDESFCGAELHSGVCFCDLCRTNAARVPLAWTTKYISRAENSEHIGWMWQIRFRGSETNFPLLFLWVSQLPGSPRVFLIQHSKCRQYTILEVWNKSASRGEACFSYVSLKALLL